jgi:uncharacterized protein YndB with AHSA1/START domain
MSEQDYTTTIRVPAAPTDVTTAVADVRGWWGADVQGGTSRVGDVFDYDVDGIHHSRIRVEEAVPGERVVWRVLENHLAFVQDQSEWVDTTIRFDLAPVDGGTELTFTHVGLVPSYECYDVCFDAWGFYIRTSLDELIRTGVGRPHRSGENGPREEDVRAMLAQ